MRSLFFSTLLGSALALSARGENLLENGSFEQPVVSGRTPTTAGGTPLGSGQKTHWKAFVTSPETEGGRLLAGLTNEIAHTGQQSLYLDFEKLTAPMREARLETELVAVKPDWTYRVSMWSRIDRKRPLALDERRPHMWLEIQFFAADGKTEAGESIRGAQLIPGIVVPGGRHELIFVSSRWNESFARVTTPQKAAFLKVSWTWMTPSDEGETDGVMYWDDACVEEERAIAPGPAPSIPEKAALKALLPGAAASPAVPALPGK